MATEITNLLELNIYLASADGTATRTLKVVNPRTDVTLAEVTTALAPMVGNTLSDGSGTAIYFFYDDGNQGGYDQPMTTITGAEVVRTVKEVTRLESA